MSLLEVDTNKTNYLQYEEIFFVSNLNSFSIAVTYSTALYFKQRRCN